MSTCIRAGVTYKRHHWKKARYTADNLVFNEFEICGKCGLERTDFTGVMATPEASEVRTGDEPTGTSQ